MLMATARAAALFAAALALAAPACYSGSAHSIPANSIGTLARDPDWQIVRDVPFVAQRDDHGCGPAALAMVLAYFRVAVPAADRLSFGDPKRVPNPSLDGSRRAEPGGDPREELARGDVRAGTLRDVARAQGLEAFVVAGTFADLFEQVGRGRPVLVGLAKPMALTGGRALAHYEVVIGLKRTRRLILSLDPAVGLRETSFEGFAREWAPTRQVTIVFLGPTNAPAGAPVSLRSRSPG